MEAPVPMLVVLLYQTHVALSPRLPPDIFKVTLLVPQVESALARMPFAAVENLFTFTSLDTQTVLLQVPSARTK
jgi:hypothetical protein